MLPFVLLFATSLAFASPVTIPFPLGLVQMPETNGAIGSPLTMILEDYSDALEVHHWLTIFDPVFGSAPVPPNFVPRPPEYYNIGRSTIWWAAIIGDTVAVFLDNQHGETPGFLIRYNDGLGCAAHVCSMDSPNVSPIPRQGDLGTFQKWEADKLLIRYGAGVPDVYFQEIDLPFRQVIPEPSTSAFAAIGLAAIILSQYKRSR